MRKVFQNIACIVSLVFLTYAHNATGQVVYKDLSTVSTYQGEYNIVTKNGATASGIVTYNEPNTNMGLSINVTILSPGDRMDFTTAEYEVSMNSNLSIKNSSQNSVDVPDKLNSPTVVNDALIPDTSVLNPGANDKKYVLELKKSSPTTNTNNFWGANNYIGFRYKTSTTNYYGWLELRIDKLTEGTKEVGVKVQLLKIAYNTNPIRISETGLERITSFNVSMENIYRDTDASNNVKFTIPHKTIGTYAMSISKIPAETADTFTVSVANTAILDYANGLITTKKNGSTDITLTAASGYVATVKMVVAVVDPTSLTIQPKVNGTPLSITQKKGSIQLKVVPLPPNTNNLNIEWSVEPNPNLITSMNPKTGELVVNFGNGDIIVKATQINTSIPIDSRVTSSETISISNQDPLPILVSSIQLTLPQFSTNMQNVKLNVGATTQITSEVLPNNADIGTLDYTSLSNHCSVDTNGLITGVSAGPCQIRASARDGSGIQATTPIITIERASSVGTLKDFSWNPLTGIINEGESVGVSITFDPVTITNTVLTWSSANENIIKVSNEENVNEVSITGVGKGVTVITAATAGGTTLSKSVRLEVKARTTDFITVQDFSISPNINRVIVGGKMNLTPLVSPSNATNQNVKWETSDATILSIVQDAVSTQEATPRQAIGTALKTGSVVISATSLQNNALVRRITLNVISGTHIPTTNIALAYKPVNGKTTVNVDDVLTPTVMIEPTSPSISQLLYLSSNPDVATVNQEGVVTAIKTGSTTITVLVTDGSQDSQGGRLKSSIELEVVRSTGLQITAIMDDKVINNVQVYPNPISDSFTISPTYDIIYPLNLELVSLNGQRVWTKRLSKARNKIYLKKKMPAGVYILKIRNQYTYYSSRVRIE